MTPLHSDVAEVTRYSVAGMDCSNCATKIEGAAREVAGVQQVRVSIASQVMSLTTEGSASTMEVERVVTALGYQLCRLDESRDRPQAALDDDVESPAHLSAGYRRALWIVVLLNIGYGVIEMAGGFISGSQALKADALDFLGDGLITFLGLLAIGWHLAWRARSALLQGVFLGALGCGVFINTVYRVFVMNVPTAELMGIFGAVALVVNVAAALVLIPHRSGDANVRAVWLFSRNDAIGNAAVVVAAGLVYWTATPWPDLAVAIVIAGLFLHSAWRIVGDARSDLAQAASAGRTA
jgi:Co/Zn/Cd efflux system component/copper chaperone CopZ